MKANHNPSDPNAIPDFDEWGWDSYWSQADWRTWYEANASEIGRKPAADKFAAAWNSRTGFWEALGDVRGDWETVNADFREWARRITLTDGSTLLAAITPGDPLSNIMGGTTDVLSNVGTSVVNTSKTLKWVLPILLVAVAISLVVIINKYPLKFLPK